MPAFRPALSPVALAAALIAAPAWAQTQPSNQQLETVTVTGIRASLESALNAKRQEKGIVDVIKAEDMGKFPDTNLAESLQRIPGVVIDRDAGEGRNITVRGLGGDFARTRINGIEALATTGGTDSSGGANRTRAFDFNVFAADLFNSLTVRKSSSADVDEGSLGATIDLQTARPFDMKKFAAAVAVKGTYNDLRGKVTPKTSFLISNTFADGKVGALLSGAYSKRKVYEEGFSTVRWDNGPSSGGWCPPQGITTGLPTGSTATTCGPAAQGVARLPNTPEYLAAYNEASKATNFHPRLPRYGRLTHDQERLGLTGSLQFRLSDTTLLTADMLYSKLEATRQEDFLEAISFSRALTAGGKQQTSVLAAEFNSAGQMVYGKFNGVDIRSESRFDVLSTEFTQPTITLEQDIGDTIKVTLRGGRAKSRFNNPIQTTTTLDAPNVDGYVFDARGDDRAPLLGYGNLNPGDANGGFKIYGVPVGSTSITNFTPSEIRIRPNGVTNKQDVLTGDVAWEVADGLTLKGGVSYKKFSFDSYDFRRTVETMNTLPANVIPASLVTTVSDFGKGQNLPAGSITSWVIPNLDAIAAAYDIYCNCLKTGVAGGPGDFRLTSITNGNARGGNRSIVETDTGAWLMADFETRLGGMPVRGNVGTRYVKTDINAAGYLATGGGSLVTADRQYKDWLPSANVSVSLTRELMLRAAAAKVMSRPPLQNLNPGGTLSTTGTLSYTGGNPQLDPFRATTLDTSLEWYHAKNAFVGLGLFHKKIKSYVLTKGFDMAYKDSGLPMSLLPSNFTGDEIFRFSAPVNSPGGNLSGFEINVQQPFSFLPGWGKNFGVLANYTQVKSKMEYVLSATGVGAATVTEDLVNLSPRSWNLSVYYDDGTFSGRVSTSSRSDFLTTVPAGNNQDVAGKKKTFNVDLSMGYKVNKQLEVTFEATNLTNQPNDQFISRGMDNVVVNNYTGREFIIGGRYKF
ncbi:TonB-dependent receptor [Roseateles asaccharophilus]|uniref:TonB-dependent receptor n=1 Tax=Roseateles asaccharophilus TaxID=582607 RepID=A0ABU2AIU2_9BURK|nr:TonB-dependent receptor [Roseateles asaccharophilus]MDR7335898.1 TonB-dependent receptor [Roseateles asaccharophilus]